MKLAKLLGEDGFTDMTSKDINNLIDTHSDPLTNEYLAEMTKSATEEEEEQDPEEE